MKAYKEKYNGESPAYTSADQYAAIQLMAAAINKANSTDVAAVRAALAGLKADTVLGDVQVRAEDHQTARPILMNQIVKTADGKAGYEVKAVFPGSAAAAGRSRLQDVTARSPPLTPRAPLSRIGAPLSSRSKAAPISDIAKVESTTGVTRPRLKTSRS